MIQDKTTILLIQHLNETPQSDARDTIIVRVKDGHYGDFISLVAAPKMELYKDLTTIGLSDLARNVTKGLYGNV